MSVDYGSEGDATRAAYSVFGFFPKMSWTNCNRDVARGFSYAGFSPEGDHAIEVL